MYIISVPKRFQWLLNTQNKTQILFHGQQRPLLTSLSPVIPFSVFLTLLQSPGRLLSFRNASSLSTLSICSCPPCLECCPDHREACPELLTHRSSPSIIFYLFPIFLVALLHGAVAFSNHHLPRR